MAKDFTVTIRPKKLIRIGRFVDTLPSQTRKGLTRAGAVFEREWKRMVGGPGFTRNPSRGSDFIGVLSGRLRSTITSQVDRNGTEVRIGPNVGYAIFHEMGTRNIPARPMIEPLWKQKGKQAIDILQDAMVNKL